jgi:hypothetical protein
MSSAKGTDMTGDDRRSRLNLRRVHLVSGGHRFKEIRFLDGLR